MRFSPSIWCTSQHQPAPCPAGRLQGAEEIPELHLGVRGSQKILKIRRMDPHRDVMPHVKPSINDRLGPRLRISLSPDSDERRRHVKPKIEIDEWLLECIICRNQLTQPVCQCRNGHMACQVCCKTRTRGQCPAPRCLQPIGRTRNKAIEGMIASLRLPCKYASHGCTRLLPTAIKTQHEGYECEFTQLDCPFPGCKFTGCIKHYSDHVEEKHKDARVLRPNEKEHIELPFTFGGFNLDSRDKFVLLKARPELFLLNQEPSALGQMLYVTSCGEDKRYSLEVVITNDYEELPKTFKAEIMTSNERTSSLRDFLLVPKQDIPSHPLPVSARCTVIVPQD